MLNNVRTGSSRLAGRAAVAGLLAAMVGAGFAPTASGASAASPHPQSVKAAAGGFKHLRNVFFSQCVDAPGGRHNVVLRIADCGSSATQNWAMIPAGPANTFIFVNQQSGECMEVNSGSSTPGELVDEFTCNGSSAELWVQEGLNLRHSGTGLCLDTVSGRGSQLAQFSCGTGVPAGTQLWIIE